MEVLSEEGVDSTPAREETDVLRGKSGGLDSPKIRRSARKNSTRSVTTRGRLMKSGPKSPLMRMAEMRKGGLRGRALRHSGEKGWDGADLRSKKGLKGSVERGLQVLAAIPECNEDNADLVEELDGEGRVADGDGVVDGGQEGNVAVMMEVRDSDEGCSKQAWQKESVQVDFALDLRSAQPLQKIDFIGVQVSSEIAGGNGKKDCLMLELNQVEGNGNAAQVNAPGPGIDEEFPPLSKESLRSVREMERNRGLGGKEGLRGSDQAVRGNLEKNKEG